MVVGGSDSRTDGLESYLLSLSWVGDAWAFFFHFSSLLLLLSFQNKRIYNMRCDTLVYFEIEGVP